MSKNKHGINPVTIRSGNGPAVTIARMGIGLGDEPPVFSVAVALVNEASETVLGDASIPQSDFVNALGHLFPHGELNDCHLYRDGEKPKEDESITLDLGRVKLVLSPNDPSHHLGHWETDIESAVTKKLMALRNVEMVAGSGHAGSGITVVFDSPADMYATLPTVSNQITQIINGIEPETEEFQVGGGS